MPMIRHATSEDVPICLSLGRLMHKQSSHSDMPYSSEETAGFMLRLIQRDDSFFAIEIIDGLICGAISGSLSKTYYGPALIANDHFIFTHPYLRKMKTATRLIKQFEIWAKIKGAKRVYIGSLAGTKTNPDSLPEYEMFGNTLMRKL